MSVEIINARSDPSLNGPPPYLQNSTRYVKSAKTVVQQNAFCDAYISEGTITHASRKSGVDPKYHYLWLERDPDYPARFKEAHAASVDHLEREARRRAVEGTEEPTGWYQGTPGGFVKKYSDTLLIFLLKGALPDKYKDRHEHTGKNGGPIEVQSTVTIEQFPIWLKQAIVVVSSGVMIDPEVEQILQAHFEAKFLEAEKLVGSGTTNQPINQIDQSGSAVEMVAESVVEEDRTATNQVESESQPNRDWRPAKRTTLDMNDI